MSYRRVAAAVGLAFLAVSLLGGAAQAKPVRARVPLQVKGDELGSVTISTLVVKAAELDDILILKEKYVVMFLEEMRRQGFRALGRENLALNQDKSEDADFILGGTMTSVDCNDEQRMTCGVSIDWQLLDKRSGAVVYQVTSRHEEMQLADLEKSDIGNQLLLGGLRSVLSRPKFVEALKRSPTATASAVEPSRFASGQIRSCPARTLSLPKQSDEALKATAVIKVNGGIGSAVVISPDGLLLTAAHVATADSVIVRFKDGKEHPATVLRVDDRTDVALLQLQDGTRDTPCLALRTETPSTGEDVFALGAPGGERLSFSVTRGIVSGFRNMDGASFIQTDTSISPGNSGGPLVDAKGQVVAIMSWKMMGRGTEGLGFGVPSASAISALSLTFGDSTGTLEAPRRAAEPAASVAGGFVDVADPAWFYVGKDAPGRTPGWVGQARGWGWVALTVGAVTVGTTALLNNDGTSPDGFRSLRTWNTVGWAVGGAGIGMVLSSYLFAPNRKPPSTARRTPPARRITAGIGAPGIGLTSIAVMGTF